MPPGVARERARTPPGRGRAHLGAAGRTRDRAELLPHGARGTGRRFQRLGCMVARARRGGRAKASVVDARSHGDQADRRARCLRERPAVAGPTRRRATTTPRSAPRATRSRARADRWVRRDGRAIATPAADAVAPSPPVSTWRAPGAGGRAGQHRPDPARPTDPHRVGGRLPGRGGWGGDRGRIPPAPRLPRPPRRGSRPRTDARIGAGLPTSASWYARGAPRASRRGRPAWPRGAWGSDRPLGGRRRADVIDRGPTGAVGGHAREAPSPPRSRGRRGRPRSPSVPAGANEDPVTAGAPATGGGGWAGRTSGG